MNSLLSKDAIKQIPSSKICVPYVHCSKKVWRFKTKAKFVSRLFTVPKKAGGLRPVTNLKPLNQFLHLQTFKMEGLSDLKAVLRRISCHGRNHSQASCEYSLTTFLCCQHHSEYSLLGSKFSTNLLFAASKCHVTIQQRGNSRCSKWPNRMGSLQW